MIPAGKSILNQNYLGLLITFLILSQPVLAQESVTSPNDSIRVTITGGGTVSLSAALNGMTLLGPSEIGLRIARNDLNWSIDKSSIATHDDVIYPAVAEKRKEIRDHYRELTIRFESKVSLHVRVYNDGFAYRFSAVFKDSITIEKETARYAIDRNTIFYGPPVSNREGLDEFHTSFEEPYLIKPLDSIPARLLFFSPVMIGYSSGVKVVITESDLEDYPGMFLRVMGQSIDGVNAGYPTEVRVNPGEFPAEVVTKRANFIARTNGTRTFPWRVFIVSNTDKQIPGNDMVYRLGAPSRIADPSWIKPGKGTDEWIISTNLFNVPFKSGVNTSTYKYYIDFAARFGFQRIMMDAGWSDNSDLFKINPEINMDELAAYAKAKGISLSMWTLAHTLNRQLEPALKQFKKWGVDFIMTDFMDRDDQKTVNFHHRIAKACAEQKIMVMYHGAFKPAGFSRTWPNAVTREAVLGSEYNIWSTKANPDHDLLLPFIRMTAGPMDYEPGILDNATEKTFRPISEKVMSMGTRMHQAAMFVVYESPIQLFSGNPSQGLLEPAFMEMVGKIPTIWDETIVLSGEVGKHIVTARKKDDVWYIGGMTNWEGRSQRIDMSFLPEGKFEASIARDGVNADKYPSDYTMSKQIVDRTTPLEITMARGGGFVVIVTRK